MVPIDRRAGSRQVVRKGGEDGLVDAPQPQGRLVGLLALALFHVALCRRGQMARPGRERIIHFAGGAVGGLEHAGRVEQPRGRLLPQVAMTGQIRDSKRLKVGISAAWWAARKRA